MYSNVLYFLYSTSPVLVMYSNITNHPYNVLMVSTTHLIMVNLGMVDPIALTLHDLQLDSPRLE